MAVVMNHFEVLEDACNCCEEVEKRNWHDMPEEVLSLIFMKLGVIGILYSAQFVCSSWRKLSKEPYLFRSLNLCSNQWDFLFKSLQEDFHHYATHKISQEAVDRSCGQVAELFLDDFCTDEVLLYTLDNSNSLKHLRFTPSYLFEEPSYQLDVLLEQICFLEELELSGCYSANVIKQVYEVCSQLKSIRLDCSYSPLDDVAFVIADTMPHLLRLHLLGTELTDIGLQALLDGCHYLEYLDLGRCIYTNIGEELQKKCQDKIKSVVLPVVSDDLHDDGIDDDDDYDNDSSIGDYDSYPSCCCFYCRAYSDTEDFLDDDIEEMADTFEEKWDRRIIGKR